MAYGDHWPTRDSDNDVHNKQYLRLQQHNTVFNLDHRAASVFAEQERAVGQYIPGIDISSSSEILADAGLA